MSRAAPSPHLDSTATIGRSLEISPCRSSVRSSSTHSQELTPYSSLPSTPLLPTRSPSPQKRPPYSADSNSFLTALAAQERRVLELREELHEADEDLEKLKKQWAVHEATKKKNESRHLQQLQPLNNTPVGSSMPSDSDSARASREIDRRRIIPSSIQSSHRKVFAGSRHTRALSLLSPRDTRSHSDLLLHGNGPANSHQAAPSSVAVPTTVPEISSVDVESRSDDLYKGPHKDVMLETGKQLVGDFRQGLWTFFEDFKQLTVGDEGRVTADLRKPPLIAPGNMPRWQHMKEKRTAFKESLVRKASASDTVREAPRKSQIEVCTSRLRVGSSPKGSMKTVAPTSSPTGFSSEGGNNASFNQSDDDEWDNWDIPKGSTPRIKDLVDEADPMESPLTDETSRRTSIG